VEEQQDIFGIVGPHPMSFGPISKVNRVVLPFQPFGLLLVDPVELLGCVLVLKSVHLLLCCLAESLGLRS
jgi:hypothetical protein